MTRRPTRTRSLFPGAVRLEACRVLWGHGGSPALFLRTLTREGRAGLFQLPQGASVDIAAKKKGEGWRAVFSSPEGQQTLDLSAGAYAGLLEGLARLREARQEVRPAGPSEDLPPSGHSLKCAALILEGEDLRPALYVGTCGPDFAAHLYRVPEGVRLLLEAPHPLPPAEDSRGRPAPLRARFVIEAPQGRAVLSVPTVYTARALLEALEAFGLATQRTGAGIGKKGAA